MKKIEVFGILLTLIAAITATTAGMLTSIQPANAACITGRSGATIGCGGTTVTGASGAIITPNCVTGVTGVTLCGF